VPVRNYLIAKLCRHSALAIGLMSVFDRLVEWTTNFLLAAENLPKPGSQCHQYGERSDASGRKGLSFGHKPKVQYEREQRVAQIRQRSEGLTTQQQSGVAVNNKKGLVVFLCILSKFRLAQLNL